MSMALPHTNSVIDDKYVLKRELGAGFVGNVYEAEQVGGGPNVAIKVLHEALAENADVRERLLEDARAASAVTHGNLGSVCDLGIGHDGQVYVVSELLRGESLAQLLARQGALPAGEACALSLQLLAGL